MSTRIKDLKRRYNEADEEYADSIEAADIIQAIGQDLQQQAHKQVSSVVSKCLACVFDDPYTFKITFERKRNRTHANLILERDGNTLTSPLNETSGGVLDVAAFALRIAALLLSKPSRRRLVFLDEPFKFVHPPEIRPRLVSMLEMLADDFDVQFVMVTGIEELRCGKVIEIK